ncbi:MFS transporter [Nocardioides sp. AE5]|uniref:MFS transporter n=1 Tax=Nocardioides sp. AE5 TaxID=2962573 RepID=UPI002881287B|nr:MFS transporter [Nocardioides sp. AE5]MDT0201377.1 MFS transporter [Nocardioides sp. AE5]
MTGGTAARQTVLVLTPYRRVLATEGALRFTTSAFVGRLPISMISLGIVLLVSARSGSYGLAGTVASAYVLANALLAIVHGRLVDRFGQALVLPLAQSAFTGALAMTVWAVQAEWGTVAIHGFAALAGACLPQLGACVRARWSWVLDEPRSVQTAYALESVVDEVVFVTGPTLVTFLATAWHPVAGLAVAGTFGIVGAFTLAAQRATEPPARTRSRAADTGPVTGSAGDPDAKPAMPWAVVGTLALVSVALGTIFGSVEVITVAFSEEQGAKAWAGPLLGMWALGSLTAGLVSGAIAWRTPPETRVAWGVLALGLTTVPLFWVDSMWVMGGFLLLGGVAIAPTLIAVMTVVEREVPRLRLTEGMAIVHTGLAAGVAPGAALAGLVIDHQGASAGYAVPVAAGVIGAIAAWVARRPITSSP